MIRAEGNSARPVRGGEWIARFIFISGRLCLDFAETGGPGERAVWERLNRPSDLADWFVESGLKLEGVQVTPAELETALELREAIWQSARAIRLGEAPRPGDIACINRAAAVPDLAPQLTGKAESRVWAAPASAAAALSAVARDAIGLFTGEQRLKIRECENPACQLVFVDASRPGKRRWCLMERCGNRVKTARYRHRHTAA